MDAVISAIINNLTLANLLFITLGVTVGVVVGSIPGLNGPMAIALTVPLTFFMPTVAAVAFLVGINKGGSFGGAIAAILLNTPGTPESAATAWDGYPLAKKGKAGKALKTALYSSVFGDTFSDLVLIIVAAPIAAVALKMGPPEICSVIIFALTIIAGLETASILKGFIAACLGMLVSTIGTDPVTATSRLTFDVYQLAAGIPLMAISIGLLALSEIILHVEKMRSAAEGEITANLPQSSDPADHRLSFREFWGMRRTLLRSALIGTGIGALPGLGTTVAAFLGYGAAKRNSKNPEEFGKGDPEGIASSEAANSAVCGANLIPLFTLGIPGNVAAALLAGAFIIHGIQPGPLIFEQNAEVIYGIYVCMIIANILHLGVGSLALRCGLLVLKLPLAYLFSGIILLCMTGAYLESYTLFAVGITFVFAFLGVLMKKYEFSFVCFLIGFVLGPMFELSLQQTLVLSGNNSPILLVTKPISSIFMALTVFVITRSALRHFRERKVQPQN
jgi:putative tricarboxylic transport membrane protein